MSDILTAEYSSLFDYRDSGICPHYDVEYRVETCTKCDQLFLICPICARKMTRPRLCPDCDKKRREHKKD